MTTKTLVHIDKNVEPSGLWTITITVEQVEDEKATTTSHTNLFFDTEPQVRYRDWTA